MAGFRQLEFLIREKLRVGLQAFRDDETLVDKVFPDLTDNSRDSLKQWLQDHDVSVVLGWPQRLDDIPAWVVSLASEGVSRTPIGGMFNHTKTYAAGAEENDDLGDLVRKTYQVFTLSLNPDLTVILATILQQILKSMRRDMDLDGFHEMIVAQQDQLNLRLDLLPERLYVRTTTVSVLVEDLITYVDTTLPTGIQVSITLDI